jgi:hypothetical protein
MKQLWLLPLLFLMAFAPANANPILACSVNGGAWTQSGSSCATDGSVFSNFSNTLDWGAPTTAGSWSAHTLEAGLGTAKNNTWNVSTNGLWMANGSDGASIGLGVGPGVANPDQVLQRVDNAAQYFSPFNGGNHWGPISSATDSYYNQYVAFAGYANSAPINTSGGGSSGGFGSNSNSTDQFYSGPYFWSHGTPNTTPSTPATGSTAVPWIGDHLVGFNTAHAQSMTIVFNGAGVDGAAFTVEGRSDSQSNTAGQITNWNQSGGGSTGNGLFELLVQAYDNTNPLLGNLLYSYDILVDGSYGQCAGLSSLTPVPCNTAPIVEILGTKGLFNIKSLVISSATDSQGFYIDELHYDQTGAGVTGGQTPEPAELFLIGGGLLVLGIGAKRRRSSRA